MRAIGIGIVNVLVLVLVSGCKDAATSGSPPAPAPESKPAKPPAPAIPDAEVTALVDRWRDAQNKGDFTAYRALYATRMTGVKRVGARIDRFDHDGWLADRERMFKKPMTVAADEVVVRASSRSAVVELEQTFQQGSFKDSGPKQLVIVREGKDLRIAREEMLRSDLAPPQAQARYLMVDNAVLLTTEADRDWRTGPVRSEPTGPASHRVVAAVDEAKLPAELVGLRKETFTAWDEHGKACQGTIDGFEIVVGVTPHFGTVQEWRDSAASEAEIAESVWGMTSPILLGSIQGCAGVVAVRGAAPAGAVLLERVADDATQAGSSPLPTFRALPAWKQAQADFVLEGGTGKGDWDAQSDDGHPVVDLFRHPTTHVIFAVVTAHAGRGCGDFEGSAGAIFERTGKTWTKRSAGDQLLFTPVIALDLDADGSPEFIGERTIVSSADGGLDVTDDFTWAFHDCDC
jgi:ketosteroid isomerase-like protein